MQIWSATRGSLAYWGALALSLSLAACGSPASSPENPDQGGGVPSDDAPQMLVLGDVQSPVFDDLKADVRFVTYDGSQAVSDFSGVIFDGDALTPEEAGSDPLIRDAFASEKWVVAFDATAAHKQETGLGKYLGFSSNFDSPAYLVNRGLDTNDKPYAVITEYPSAPITVTPETGVTTASRELKISKQASAEFRKKVVSSVKGETLASLQTGGGGITNPVNSPTSDFPSDLPYYPITYTPPTQNWSIPSTRKTQNPQNMSLEMTYQFYVFLDNENLQSSYQYVVTEISAVATPTTAFDQTNGQPIFASTESSEQAWWQDQVVVTIAPDDSSNFTSPKASPATSDNEVQVTSGSSFMIGFQGNEGLGSYTYSDSTTYDIPDWTVTNEIDGNEMIWSFYSENPNSLQPYGCIGSIFNCNGFDKLGFPNSPSALSSNTAQLYAQAIWQTPPGTVLDDWEQFDLYASQRVADTFCLHTFLDESCNGINNTGYLTGIHTIAWDTSIDMGAVLPTSTGGTTFE